MTFDPARVPVQAHYRHQSQPEITAYTVDLRPFAAWLLREMACARKDARQGGTIDLPTEWQRLADKIAAASGEQGSLSQPRSTAGSSPAAPLKPEIREAIAWLRLPRSMPIPSFFDKTADLIERLARELDEARAALRWVNNQAQLPPAMNGWPPEHQAAILAARETADGK